MISIWLQLTLSKFNKLGFSTFLPAALWRMSLKALLSYRKQATGSVLKKMEQTLRLNTLGLSQFALSLTAANSKASDTYSVFATLSQMNRLYRFLAIVAK